VSPRPTLSDAEREFVTRLVVQGEILLGETVQVESGAYYVASATMLPGGDLRIVCVRLPDAKGA
jgi:hypothetical protein